MAHSYSRSSGAPTELQQPPPHGYEERREQPLTLPPISAAYPPQQGHYDPRYDGRLPVTLPSIHPHPPHSSQHPGPYQQRQGPLPPQQYQHQQPYRSSHEGNRPSHEAYRFEPYPQSERPPHLQQSQAQKYATLPSEPYVPSRSGAHGVEAGHVRAMKKISQSRGERPGDKSDRDHRGAQDKPNLSHPSHPQPNPNILYTNAPPKQVVGRSHQHISPRTAHEEQPRWQDSRPELQQSDIRKRSASGDSGKMLTPNVSSLSPYISQESDSTSKMDVQSVVSDASPSSSSNWVYSLTMRQQPLAARACGFGERDRRVIDPPPILELNVFRPNASPDQIKERLRNSYYVVHCSLWSADYDVDNSAMDDASSGGRGSGSGQRRLMGTLVASPFYGKDEFGVDGCFFCFPDLSCRTTGRYRLKFNMVSLNPMGMVAGDRRPFCASIISNVVVVYAAKDFPGMSSSSKLTRRLKEQGCLISVKKGIERVGEKRPKNAPKEEEEGDDDDEEETTPRGGRQS